MRVVCSFFSARFVSAIFIAVPALLLCSCEPHTKLINQIAEVRIELDTTQRSVAQAESELARMAREENDLRSALPLRLGTETTVRKNNLLRADIENLKQRKADLEASLPLLKADFESYCKKYL
jgi:predicted  nucleic acid-binding Zn-ribbon protein